MKKRIVILSVIASVVLLSVFFVFGGGFGTVGVKIAVLMYHHLMPEEEIVQNGHQDNKSILPVEIFYAQMEMLKQQGFHTATMDELEKFLAGEITLPQKTVAITFDDGYFSNIEYAYPVLKTNNQSGTIFMIGSLALRKEDGWLKYIKHGDISKYEDVFSFESHTYDMHNTMDDRSYLIIAPLENVKEDMVKNRDLFNARYFAYPFGQYNRSVIEILKETGHRLAFTTKKGYLTPNTKPYEIPRFAINREITGEEFDDIINGRR